MAVGTTFDLQGCRAGAPQGCHFHWRARGHDAPDSDELAATATTLQVAIETRAARATLACMEHTLTSRHPRRGMTLGSTPSSAPARARSVYILSVELGRWFWNP